MINIRFLLIKCINGEKATYNTGVFSAKRERTFQVCSILIMMMMTMMMTTTMMMMMNMTMTMMMMMTP